MGNELLASKTVIREKKPAVKTIQALPPGITGMCMVTERGPLTRQKATSLSEWERYYGGVIAGSYGPTAVKAFFEMAGDGAELWTQRIVHYTDITDTGTKTSAAGSLTLNTDATSPSPGVVLASIVEPYALTPGDTLVLSVDGGAGVTATFTATAGLETSGNTENFALSDGQTLTVKVDGGPVQTATFDTGEFGDIANATAQEVANVINAEMTGLFAEVVTGAVRITSDKKGTGSSIEVTGGTANGALGFPTDVNQGTGNVVDISAVTAAEVVSVVTGAVGGITGAVVAGAPEFTTVATGASASVQVTAPSTADDEIGFDNATHSGASGAAVATGIANARYDGEYSDGVRVIIANATSGEAEQFNLQVEEDNVVVQTLANLDADTVAAAVNDLKQGSPLITWTDQAAPGTLLQRRPVNGTFGPLAGGADGTAGITDTDYIGDKTAETGMRSFDKVSAMSLLGIPGQATSTLHNAMVQYCEVTRKGSIFPVFEVPQNSDADQAVTYVTTTSGLYNSSEFGAVYWPWVKVENPNKTVFGDDDLITIPPTGPILGLYVQRDRAREGGIHDPPSGIEFGKISIIKGLESEDPNDEEFRDIVFPKNINPIRKEDGGTDFYADGGRLLSQEGAFPWVSVRRGVIFIEQSIKSSIDFARQNVNTADNRARAQRVTKAFLLKQTRLGAFRTKDPELAFTVDFDIKGEGINRPSEQFGGRLNGEIGLATNKIAEFILLTFGQDERDLLAELEAA